MNLPIGNNSRICSYTPISFDTVLSRAGKSEEFYTPERAADAPRESTDGIKKSAGSFLFDSGFAGDSSD